LRGSSGLARGFGPGEARLVFSRLAAKWCLLGGDATPGHGKALCSRSSLLPRLWDAMCRKGTNAEPVGGSTGVGLRPGAKLSAGD